MDILCDDTLRSRTRCLGMTPFILDHVGCHENAHVLPHKSVPFLKDAVNLRP